MQDRREIELPATADDELRRVADPPLIRRDRLKLPVQEIGRDRLVVITHRRARIALAEPRLQPVFLHQAHDPFAADVLVLRDQVFVNARAAVALLARRKRRPHQHFQPAIVARMPRFRTRAPGVEAASRDVEPATE